jgi:hypothetical protein
MIVLATGSITFKNEAMTVGSSLTRSNFLTSALGRISKVNVENEPHCSYSTVIPADALMSLPVGLTLYFYHQQLECVSIVASDSRFGSSWNDWSEEKEKDRKRFHDQWLVETIGTTSAQFPWGQLSSDYDGKSGFSAIHLRYSWQGKLCEPQKTAK